MRMRRKPNLLSRIDKCAHLLTSNPENLRGEWLDNIVDTNSVSFNELHIELGCGKGLFTSEKAKRSPETLLVALEKTSNVLVIALERARDEQIRNIRFINRLADDLLDFFAKDEVSRIYINFCDPWPANRHAKRRLTGQRFLKMYETILRKGGEIHFKTDNFTLFDFSINEFMHNGFFLLEKSLDIHKHGPVGIMTDYEDKYYDQEMPIYRCIVQK